MSIIITIVIGLLVILGIAYLITMKSNTLPIVDAFTNIAPGLDGGDRILSHYEAAPPACSSDEYQELKVLLAKMAALKIDIQSNSGTLDATMYLPFVTKHDREQVAETAGKCMSKSIPRRDLDLIFDLWSSRGHELISSLSSAAGIADERAASIHALFDAAVGDVQSVAISKCLIHELPMDKKAASPRDIAGITPDVGSDYTPSYVE